SIDFRGARIEVSPPASQGILLLVALRWWLRNAPARGEDAERLAKQVEAIERCFAYRGRVTEPDAEEALLGDDVEPVAVAGGGGPRGYTHTAAITVADRSGAVVSALVSVFDDFGSATLVPELEFHLNSRLLGFDGSGSNSPAPGRWPVHTL